jgi:hypothetical protein
LFRLGIFEPGIAAIGALSRIFLIMSNPTYEELIPRVKALEKENREQKTGYG